ncbi:hypothetical protein [Streptomyces sp. NPDC051636]|uniref:hypothetical protein n=1 Tax=Streptomyces sp. NPDC051636 TaxID=3365663 RepID=UPI0037AE635E
MVRKRTEGDERQRRAAARETHGAGEAPSARSATTGASKQRTHLSGRDSLSHEERVGTLHRGTQQWRGGDPAEPGVRDPAAQGPMRTFAGRGHPDHGESHERVLRALGAAQERSGGEGVYLEDIAGTAGLPVDECRALLHDLTRVHRLVTELAGSDEPDLGPRFQMKPRM